MNPAPARTAEQRKTDTLAALSAVEADVWVSSASATGQDAEPYLVPLSLAWLDGRVVIALHEASRTALNILRHRSARLGLGPTRDVVMIDAELEHSVPVGQDDLLASRYVVQAGWDPRSTGDGYLLMALRPVRIQAWREANELPGRILMRDGSWLV